MVIFRAFLDQYSCFYKEIADFRNSLILSNFLQFFKLLPIEFLELFLCIDYDFDNKIHAP